MAEPVKARYERLAAERQNALDRARLCSKVTIPSVLPPEGANGSTTFDTPFQSAGASGVNSLGSQLTLILMPPNAPFFRLKLDELRFGPLTEDNPKIKQEVEEELGKVERRVMEEIEIAKVRITFSEAVKHVIIAGIVLLYVPDTGSARYFPLSKFVLDQDPEGNLREIIIREHIDPSTLSEEIQAAIKPPQTTNTPQTKPLDDISTTGDPKRSTVELYTWIQRTSDKKFSVHQEINGYILPGSTGSFLREELPYLPIPYQPVEGSPYARGLIEEYLGDLLTAEGLSQAIVEGSLAAARTLNLVRPNAVVRMKDLNEAPNNSYVYGNEGDVTRVQSEAGQDLRVASDTLNRVLKSLSGVFMQHQSVQRDAERVTAEEIRFMAQQLEQNLGGAYSVLSQAFQLPLVTIMLSRLEKQKLIGKIDNKTIHPVVITGLEGLGRGNDLNRLDVFVGQSFAQLKELVTPYLNVGEYLSRRATALGIETKGLIYTAEEIAQRQAQQTRQQVVTDVAPVAVKEAMSSANQTA